MFHKHPICGGVFVITYAEGDQRRRGREIANATAETENQRPRMRKTPLKSVHWRLCFAASLSCVAMPLLAHVEELNIATLDGRETPICITYWELLSLQQTDDYKRRLFESEDKNFRCDRTTPSSFKGLEAIEWNRLDIVEHLALIQSLENYLAILETKRPGCRFDPLSSTPNGLRTGSSMAMSAWGLRRQTSTTMESWRRWLSTGATETTVSGMGPSIIRVLGPHFLPSSPKQRLKSRSR